MQFLFSILVLIVIAYIIGNNMAERGKDVGFRSIALVMLGAFSFTTLSMDQFGIPNYRIIGQIVTGISFVGAGLIFKDKSVHNLTTAIAVWVCASIGILIRLYMLKETIIIALVLFLILSYKKT